MVYIRPFIYYGRIFSNGLGHTAMLCTVCGPLLPEMCVQCLEQYYFIYPYPCTISSESESKRERAGGITGAVRGWIENHLHSENEPMTVLFKYFHRCGASLLTMNLLPSLRLLIKFSGLDLVSDFLMNMLVEQSA